MKKIHVPNMGPDVTQIPKAIAVGVRECQAVGTDVLTLITPAKDNLGTIVVGEVLGRDVAKRLMNGELIPVGGTGVRLRHESAKTVRKGTTPKVGLAFYVSTDDVEKLDELDFGCLIFVPWHEDDGGKWAQKWDAETIGKGTQGSEVNLPVEVIKALDGLTASVNLSTGLGHPSDKDHAKRVFAGLRSDRLKWNPDEVEKWAVRNRWRAGDARELAELSARYL